MVEVYLCFPVQSAFHNNETLATILGKIANKDLLAPNCGSVSSLDD